MSTRPVASWRQIVVPLLSCVSLYAYPPAKPPAVPMMAQPTPSRNARTAATVLLTTGEVQVSTYTPEQRKVVKAILKVGRQRGASPKEVKAAIETGLVESNLRNLSGGDADSAGWRQERASLYPDPTNVTHAAARFFDEAKKANASGRYGSAGSLAAAVQRPAAQFRGRYQQRSGDADALLAGFGGGGPSAASSSTTTTRTSTTPGVDNSQVRRDLVAGFLAQGGVKNSEATATFAAAYRSAQDVPGALSTTRVRASSPSSRDSGATPGKGGSKVLELIYNDGGSGYGIKDGQVVNGQQVFSGVWAGHADHVHVAAGPGTVEALGKLAQSLGLHVGENPHFGGVSPVHVQDSYHYKGEAIDVSGDPKLMKRFARKVEQYNRTQKLP